jgi:hypothetical protein
MSRCARRLWLPHLPRHGLLRVRAPSDHQSCHGSSALFEEASELLGHHTGQRREHDGGAIGTRYRHMTLEMQARVLPVIEQHLATM